MSAEQSWAEPDQATGFDQSDHVFIRMQVCSFLRKVGLESNIFQSPNLEVFQFSDRKLMRQLILMKKNPILTKC